MSKKTALLLLIFVDLWALFALWLGYDSIKQVYIGVADTSDIISFNNRVGFLFVAVTVPLAHIFALCDYFFLHKVLIKKVGSVNTSFVVLGVVIFTAAFLISNHTRTYVETAGYQHCPEVDDHMTFSTYLVYTRDDAICRGLVADKEKGHSTATR